MRKYEKEEKKNNQASVDATLWSMPRPVLT